MDEAGAFVKTVPTGEDGAATFRVVPAAGSAAWTEGELAELEAVVDLLVLHCTRSQLLEMVRNSALTQYLTGLPNSGGYLKRVAAILAEGRINEFNAYYFNLKGTSIMNIKYGQRDSDEIIRRYARTLHEGLDKDELLGHLGGDNFVALILKENEKKFQQRLKGIDLTVDCPTRQLSVHISATVGMMHIEDTPMPGPWMIISGPAIALQNARGSGQDFVLLTEDMIERSSRSRQVENNFYAALEEGQFHPYYQPKVDMRTGEIVGAEVLARWIVNGQVMPPVEFIPVLERTGKIVDLDLYMLEQACIDMNHWKKQGRRPVPLSVNISRRDVELPETAERIRQCFEKYDIASDELLIEVTETANERESNTMKRFLNQLLLSNIGTSIDDFGTGFSSLSFLRDFPAREIKIDRSFINHPMLRDKDRVIIGSIIEMAKHLGLDVITEGVENKAQVDFLLQLGCLRAQGFLYDKPLPREEFEDRLSQGRYNI